MIGTCPCALSVSRQPWAESFQSGRLLPSIPSSVVTRKTHAAELQRKQTSSYTIRAWCTVFALSQPLLASTCFIGHVHDPEIQHCLTRTPTNYVNQQIITVTAVSTIDASRAICHGRPTCTRVNCSRHQGTTVLPTATRNIAHHCPELCSMPYDHLPGWK